MHLKALPSRPSRRLMIVPITGLAALLLGACASEATQPPATLYSVVSGPETVRKCPRYRPPRPITPVQVTGSLAVDRIEWIILCRKGKPLTLGVAGRQDAGEIANPTLVQHLLDALARPVASQQYRSCGTDRVAPPWFVLVTTDGENLAPVAPVAPVDGCSQPDDDIWWLLREIRRTRAVQYPAEY